MTLKNEQLDRERRELLHRLAAWLDTPMLLLGFVWLGLLVLELTRGLSRSLEVLGIVIWVIFILDFLVRLVLAPERGQYLKSQWLTVVSLVVPAFRALRIVRAF